MHQAQQLSATGPAGRLKIFAADPARDGRQSGRSLSPETTLSQFFREYFLPVYLRSRMADSKTVAEYWTAVHHWVRFVWDPPLRLVDNAACASFVYEDLYREIGPPVSPNTVRKHCTHLQMILHGAGPQTAQYPWAATSHGLFGMDAYGRPRPTPWFLKPPEREKPAEDGLTLEEISRLLDVAESAVKPALQTCSPAAWWRAILVFGYNTGLRRGSLLALRRSWIRVCGEGGVLALPARASKKGLPKQIWVSAEAMAAIAELATGDLVFPWPESAASFDRHRRRLWQRAGVDPAHTFHGLRKAIGSELWSIDPKAAQLQLGHAAESTTRRHYVSQAAADASLARNLGPASRRVRQPKAGGGQLSLF